ncbi:hypothetical protein Tco_1247992, partial [Tanacetum coccineum]
CNMLSAIHTDQMHQPWRTFVAIINRCIFRKTTGLDRLRESRAQILWGMYNKKNVDYVALLWEDFMYQADNREISSARKEHMPYPRFTKVIINHLISKDKTISMRNRIKLHIIRDDSLLDIKDSVAYKTYYDFATGKVPPRKARKYKKVASPSRKLSPVKKAEPVKKAKRIKRPAKKFTTAPTAGVAIKDTPGVFVSKKKAHAKADGSKGIEILSDVALSEAAQHKEATKRSKKDFHISQASGSGIKAMGLEVGSIRHIQGIGYGVLEFLGVGTTLDIFQNIHILYLKYGVLISSGYDELNFIPLWSLVSSSMDTPYLP